MRILRDPYESTSVRMRAQVEWFDPVYGGVNIDEREINHIQ